MPGERTIIGQILDTLSREIRNTVRRYLRGVLRDVVKTLLLGVVGIAFVAAGLIFTIIAFVSYLSEFLPDWMAWGSVGIVTALIGVILLLSLKR